MQWAKTQEIANHFFNVLEIIAVILGNSLTPRIGNLLLFISNIGDGSFVSLGSSMKEHWEIPALE